MKRRTVSDKKPVGVYGGDVNGSNPMEWSLRNTILAQLRNLGWTCNADSFGDGSGSWIGIYKEDPSKIKDGKLLHISIGFNHSGSIIQDIQVFEERVVTRISEDTKKIL